MKTKSKTPVTIALGGGWKMTLTRADQYSTTRPHGLTMDTWCGLARTDLPSVIIYEDYIENEDGATLVPHPDAALAEVIFESRWQQVGESWKLEYPGRTYYAACPSSGEGGEAETALLELIPLELVLSNIRTLAVMALRGVTPKD